MSVKPLRFISWISIRFILCGSVLLLQAAGLVPTCRAEGYVGQDSPTGGARHGGS